MAKPKPTPPSFESSRDIDGKPHERLVWRYAEGIGDVAVLVERDTMVSNDAKSGRFVGEVVWSWRGRVSLDEAEQFAVKILDGVKRARKMIACRDLERAREVIARPNNALLAKGAFYLSDVPNSHPAKKTPCK